MKSEKVKEMLDSCYMAKRILDMLPKLPEGVLPSYVRYLETIIELEEKNQKVKVSDVSEVLSAAALPSPLPAWSGRWISLPNSVRSHWQ